MGSAISGPSNRLGALRWLTAASPLVLAAAMLGGSPAYAQGMDQAGSAQSAADASVIVVTARFREENLQQTPLAITAISDRELEARNLTNITGLDAQAPNVRLTTTGQGFGPTLAAYIRGIGVADFALAFEPGVPIYIDDVYHGRPAGAIVDLLDLERIEVLRGPQGTLFGKNAVGGAIRLISKKPSGGGGGFIEGTTGSYNRLEMRGAFDLPIPSDNFFGRLSFSHKQRDGYAKILDFECVNGPGTLGAFGSQVGPTTSKDCVVDRFGDENATSARLAFRWIPSDALEINLSGDWTRQRQGEVPQKTTIIDPNANSIKAWNAIIGPKYGVILDNRFVTDDPFTTYTVFKDPITGLDVGNHNDMDQWGVQGNLEWKIADNIALTSISAYRTFDAIFSSNSSNTPLPATLIRNENPHRQFTQEFRLSGLSFDKRLDWTIGGFYYKANDKNRSTLLFFPGYAPFASQNTGTLQDQDTTSKAVFAHAVFNITSKLRATGGIRYTKDEKDVHWTAQRLDNGVFTRDLFIPASATRWSYKAGLDYQLTPGIMLYGQYSTGFRGGGFSPRATTADTISSFGPEDLKTYEIGAKTDWFDRRIVLNVASFYSIYTNLQLQTSGFNNVGLSYVTTRNAGRAVMKGFEGELTARPIDGLSLVGSVGYLGFKFTDLGAADPAAIIAAGGSPSESPCLACRLVRAPKWTASLGGQYKVDLEDLGSITPRVDWSYRSKIFFNAPNTTFENGYSLYTARVTWNSPDNAWSIALSGTNLGNKLYKTYELAPGGLGFNRVAYGRPREWALSVKRVF